LKTIGIIKLIEKTIDKNVFSILLSTFCSVTHPILFQEMSISFADAQEDTRENGIGNFIDVERKAPYSRKGQFFATVRESFRKWRDSSIAALLRNDLKGSL
jgi:hypothetical protein